MSLLEDVFLQDETGEARELERVIDGEEYHYGRRRSDSLPRDSDDDSEKENEAEEDKKRVDPNENKSKRVVKNPRFTLNPARLTGPRGIKAIPDHFIDFKFKGKGHETEDLDLVLKNLEHWAYRLYPKFQFEDCLKKIETLGRKRPVMVHLHKIRSGQLLSEETVVDKDPSDDEAVVVPQEDEFDILLQQQIELARATPAPSSVKIQPFDTPGYNRSPETKLSSATISPSMNDEQRERMLRNRKMAEERRLARINQGSNSINMYNDQNISDTNILETPEIFNRKSSNNRSVIDSSDDECNVHVVNQSIEVEVHNSIIKSKSNEQTEIKTNREFSKNINFECDGKHAFNNTNFVPTDDEIGQNPRLEKGFEIDNNICSKLLENPGSYSKSIEQTEIVNQKFNNLETKQNNCLKYGYRIENTGTELIENNESNSDSIQQMSEIKLLTRESDSSVLVHNHIQGLNTNLVSEQKHLEDNNIEVTSKTPEQYFEIDDISNAKLEESSKSAINGNCDPMNKETNKVLEDYQNDDVMDVDFAEDF